MDSKPARHGQYIYSFNNADPFDCSDDPCHLAWIIWRDSRDLSDYIHNGKCSNGTSFHKLSAEGLKDCPQQNNSIS